MSSKIVIIEDETAVAEMYRFKLQRSGYEVKIALDGEEGFKLVSTFRPALILLGLMMPKMSGDEVLEKIRAEEWSAYIRVIILTNLSKDEAPAKLRLLNVDRYIVKAHCTPGQVLSIVEEVIGEKA